MLGNLCLMRFFLQDLLELFFFFFFNGTQTEISSTEALTLMNDRGYVIEPITKSGHFLSFTCDGAIENSRPDQSPEGVSRDPRFPIYDVELFSICEVQCYQSKQLWK